MEDSRSLRRQIVRCVQETGGLEVVGEAESVRRSIDEIGRLRPEILIVDIQLSDGTGWEVIDSLNIGQFQTIILTNSADPVSRGAAAERKVQCFFDKTTQFDDFLDCISGMATRVCNGGDPE